LAGAPDLGGVEDSGQLGGTEGPHERDAPVLVGNPQDLVARKSITRLLKGWGWLLRTLNRKGSQPLFWIKSVGGVHHVK